MNVVVSFMRPVGRFVPRNRLQVEKVFRVVGLPGVGLLIFLALWDLCATQIDTSLGQFPGPAMVWEQAINLVDEHIAEREREVEFYERQEQRSAERVKVDPDYVARVRPYTGPPTFLDQIGTSLVTVLSGFLLATVIAVPWGISIGLSRTLYSAFNPIIQLFKPVSPLAWLPLVTMVVSAVYVTDDPMVPKSFVNSMITVTLCCLWPIVINTAMGVAEVDPDLVNVSRVLRLSTFGHVKKIVLPSAVPIIFTGLRISLGIAWMVLIAAEMLAQNPGLGKFVWDEFQNGSSGSLSRIMVAVVTIGFVGLVLDRAMLALQNRFSWASSRD